MAFDSKLNWQIQVQNAIAKSNKSLHAIKLISKQFSNKETLQLITSNYYSVLYYNSEIWHLPSLTNPTKKTVVISVSSTTENLYKELRPVDFLSQTPYNQ